MSHDRKVLVARRKNDRDKSTNLTQTFRINQEFNSSAKRAAKRPIDSPEVPKKNLANDRLKRLRLALNDDAHVSVNQSHRPNSASTSNRTDRNAKSRDNIRKRPQLETNQSPLVKQFKQEPEYKSKELNRRAFTPKDVIQSKIFTTTSTMAAGPSTQNSGETEAMEWSTMDGDDVSSAVKPVSPDSTSGTSHMTSTNCTKKFFVVVDTNILLSHLQVIKDIVNVKIIGDSTPVIIIPWMVIEELDFIKDDSKKSNIKFKAQEAVRYIDQTMSSQNERMKGQSLQEVNEQEDTGKNPDNKILSCCIQVLKKHKDMILVTADINLKNKAHFNSIPVCSHSDIMAKIIQRNQAKAQYIRDQMTELCSTVIHSCAKEAYGPACVKMPICQTSLESLEDCIGVFTKYWFPVFQEMLLKQFKKAIDDLSIFLTEHTDISDESTAIGELLRLCVRVCLFLKDVQCCKDSIENTILTLNTIKET